MRARALVLATAMLAFGCAMDASSQSPGVRKAANWTPLDPIKPYAGKSLTEWGAAWVRWSLAQTSCESPVTDVDGSQCALYQESDSEVFFLAFAPSLEERSECVVPAGKAVLVPVAPFSVQIIPGERPRSEAELQEEASAVLASMRDLTLTIDDLEVEVSADFAVGPMSLAVELPPAPNFFSCRGVKNVSELVLDPVVAAGYFVLLPPPAPGEHTVVHTGVAVVDGSNAEFGAATRFRFEEP